MGMRLGAAVCGAVLLMASVVAAQECQTFQECMAGMCQNGACVGVPLNSGPCDDGNPCTTGDSCVNGQCMGTPTAGGQCNDGNECTVDDTCTEFFGQVVCMGAAPAAANTPCQGGCGVCQEFAPGAPPFCVLAEGKLDQECTPPFADSPCISGTCRLLSPGTQFAVCFPAPKQCPDTDGDPCTGEYCNPETGQCVTAPLPARLDCLPAECHRCVAGTGQCVPINVGGSCDDGNVCTASSVCASDGRCIAGSAQPTATSTATTAVNTATPTKTQGANTATPTNTGVVNTATPTKTQGTPAATATMGRCVGDCNHNGKTVVNEVVTGVNIALDRAPITSCPEFDLNGNLKVEVNELVSGVNSLLHGCVQAAALR